MPLNIVTLMDLYSPFKAILPASAGWVQWPHPASLWKSAASPALSAWPVSAPLGAVLRLSHQAGSCSSTHTHTSVDNKETDIWWNRVWYTYAVTDLLKVKHFVLHLLQCTEELCFLKARLLELSLQPIHKLFCILERRRRETHWHDKF